MKDIDFLPLRYRERHERRQAAIWRGAVMIALLALVGLVAVGQLTMRRKLDWQLAAVNRQFPQATAAHARIELLQKDLVEAEQFAELYAYLRHPWPTTQLLVEIAAQTPGSVVLTEVTVGQNKSSTSGPRPAISADQPKDSGEAARQDLVRLRATCDSANSIVTVAGITSDAIAVHGFVAQLAKSPLFREAKLQSIASVKSAAANTTLRFELQLITAPGIGQPGGAPPPGNLVPAGTSSTSLTCADLFELLHSSGRPRHQLRAGHKPELAHR